MDRAPGSTGAHRNPLSLTTVAIQVKLNVFWDYAKAVGLWTTLVICLLYMGQSAAAIGANMWLGAWTNEAVVGGGQNNTSLRLGVYATLGILQGKPVELPGRGSNGPFLTPGLLGPPNHTLASECPFTITAIALPQCLSNPP